MKKLITTLLAWLGIGAMPFAQNTYTYYLTGDSADVNVMPQPGLVLAGGGGDNDQAMKWMLQRANGGDVVVIRASGANGYNNYFYSQLGVAVNSVETIVFHSVAAATDTVVISRIKAAEVLFVSGGDQYNYYQYWKDTPIEDAINYLLNEKKATVGGTSAGMAILGNAYYTPPGGSATSQELLADPFHPNANILGYGDFLTNPYLPALITDTHYDQRNRSGRHLVFMARLAVEHNVRTFGIACNEYTAVCIDEQGTARVFGEYPAYDDFAYFLATNCQNEFLPEVMMPATPFTWNRGNAAVKVVRLPGLPDGSNAFDVPKWEAIMGGENFDWYAHQGQLFKLPDANPDCAAFSTAVQPANHAVCCPLKLSPNPVTDWLRVEMAGIPAGFHTCEVFDIAGKHLLTNRFDAGNIHLLDVRCLPKGTYLLKVNNGNGFTTMRFLK